MSVDCYHCIDPDFALPHFSATSVSSSGGKKGKLPHESLHVPWLLWPGKAAVEENVAGYEVDQEEPEGFEPESVIVCLVEAVFDHFHYPSTSLSLALL